MYDDDEQGEVSSLMILASIAFSLIVAGICVYASLKLNR